MAEATWGDATGGDATGGDATAPSIDWKMSASLEDVTRGGEAVPEVTNLEAVVRAWQQLDPGMQADAVLTLERPVRLDSDLPLDQFVGSAIGDLVRRLPGTNPQDQ